MQKEKQRKTINILGGVILGVFILVGINVHAQVIPQAGAIRTTIRPQQPRPKESVSITIESFSFDLSRAVTSWYENGTLIESGTGIKKINTMAPALGSSKIVRVLIRPQGGATLEHIVRITPASVDLLWEARSYTPPFYKGKRLHSAGGSLRIIALPQIVSRGSRVADPSLVYTWRKNGVVLGSKSGTGKNMLSIAGSQLGFGERISVSVSTQDEKISAEGSINIPVSSTRTIVYENDPLLGIVFEKSIRGELDLIKKEIRLEAYPYFFSTLERGANKLNYSWQIAGSESSNDPYVTLRRGEGAGSASALVSVNNIVDILQSARRSITIRFSGDDESR